MKSYLIPSFGMIICSLLFFACQKEIDIDYPSVSPIPVIEGSVSNEGMVVSVTYSRNMNDSVKAKGVDGAQVVVTSSDGDYEVLTYQATDGKYHSSAVGKVGVTYILSVTMQGKHYQACSTMHAGFPIWSEGFKWWTLYDNRIVIYELMMSDLPDEDNYYWFRMLRNGEAYGWQVQDDRGRKNTVIPILLTCMSEQMAKDNEAEYRDYILYEGDKIETQVLSIDRNMYDYLKSLSLSGRTSANPMRTFEGDECLGYFSAHTITRHHRVFSYADMSEYVE